MREDITFLVQEIADLYEASEDINRLKHVAQLKSEFVQRTDRIEQDAKEVIRQLTTKVERSKQTATRKEPESAHRDRVQKLDNERKQAISSINDLESEIKKLSSESTQQQEVRKEIGKQISAVDENQTVQVPRVKHALSLYANVSGIRWDYESEETKGYVSVSVNEKRETRPFSIEPNTSKFDATNYLWDLMD